MRNLLFFIIISLFFLQGCSLLKPPVPPPPPLVIVPVVPVPVKIIPDYAKTSPFLDSMLKSNAFFETVRKSRKNYRVQIIYTQIDRSADGSPNLTDYYFNVEDSAYFYPASTVKLPVCLLALQKLGEINNGNAHCIDKNTTMLTEAAYSGQTAVYNDPTTLDGKPSIAQYIKKVLMVSDNDAYNRLYEFVGPEYIKSQLAKRNFPMSEIIHRLSIPLSEDENRHTNPIKFLDEEGFPIFNQPLQYNLTPYPVRKDSVGIGYYDSDNKLVCHPMNFSKKNRLPLTELHRILTGIVFPGVLPAADRFDISPEDRNFMLKYMSQWPTESISPSYSDDLDYYPAYCKFLLFGAEKGSMPANIRVFNKVGDAYGQLTDAAYVVDFNNKVEFMLSATIYCNHDEIINDEIYDYETVGLPFMKQLGELIYKHELKRNKKILPDLSEFKFDYDKK